jgi:hypothetical protein
LLLFALPNLSEADRADVESFLQDILSILPLIGLTAFEKPRSVPRRRRQELYVASKGVHATGTDAPEGFVVFKDSQAVTAEVPSIHSYLSNLRKDLCTQGVLMPHADHLVFTQDYVFNSPSTAAGVVLGRSANGRIEWKNKAGKTLKEIQEAAVPADS